jgi:hypothetical protein
VEALSFWLGRFFASRGDLGPQIRPGVFAVRCPNEAAHTSGRAFDTSTVIFAPSRPHERGTFYCSHTSGCSEVFK